MRTIKQQGVGGEWTKVTITVGECTYSRNTSPEGKHQYANVSGRNSVSIRSGGKTALIIDMAIANKQISKEIDMTAEFERNVAALGVNVGCTAYTSSNMHIYYLNEHVQWLWLQFLKMKGLNNA